MSMPRNVENYWAMKMTNYKDNRKLAMAVEETSPVTHYFISISSVEVMK